MAGVPLFFLPLGMVPKKRLQGMVIAAQSGNTGQIIIPFVEGVPGAGLPRKWIELGGGDWLHGTAMNGCA